jgi:hypothetical protein
MKTRNIFCYFCKEKSLQEEDFDTSGSIRVRCPSCGYYKLTFEVIKFCIHGKDPVDGAQDFLDDPDNQCLSAYVMKRYNQTRDVPVLVDLKAIKSATGKVPIGIKYV